MKLTNDKSTSANGLDTQQSMLHSSQLYKLLIDLFFCDRDIINQPLFTDHTVHPRQRHKLEQSAGYLNGRNRVCVSREHRVGCNAEQIRQEYMTRPWRNKPKIHACGTCQRQSKKSQQHGLQTCGRRELAVLSASRQLMQTPQRSTKQTSLTVRYVNAVMNTGFQVPKSEGVK